MNNPLFSVRQTYVLRVLGEILSNSVGVSCSSCRHHRSRAAHQGQQPHLGTDVIKINVLPRGICAGGRRGDEELYQCGLSPVHTFSLSSSSNSSVFYTPRTLSYTQYYTTLT